MPHEYLAFRLYGMMASWGDIAVGEFRPTYDHPSRSAILGMLGAALGIRRDEEERLASVAGAYRVSVRTDLSGVLLRDYHTSQVPRKSYQTRKQELEAPQKDISTILSTRDYRCDAAYTVCVWSAVQNPPYSLNELQQGLREPVFVLSMGRKSCPPSLPLNPQVVTGENLCEAYSLVQFHDDQFLSWGRPENQAPVFWEGDEDVGIEKLHTVLRRDNPLSRRRWQFGDRREHYGMTG